jgi:hypothetical protein
MTNTKDMEAQDLSATPGRRFCMSSEAAVGGVLFRHHVSALNMA